MPEPEEAKDRAARLERAERIRDAFRKSPGFMKTLRKSQGDEAAGRYISQEDLLRKYPVEE